MRIERDCFAQGKGVFVFVEVIGEVLLKNGSWMDDERGTVCPIWARGRMLLMSMDEVITSTGRFL